MCSWNPSEIQAQVTNEDSAAEDEHVAMEEETPAMETQPKVEDSLPQQSSPSRGTASEPPMQTITREARPQVAPTQDLCCQAAVQTGNQVQPLLVPVQIQTQAQFSFTS